MNFSWKNSIGFRIGALVTTVLVVAALLIATNLHVLSRLRGEHAWMQRMNDGPALGYRIVYLAERIRSTEGPDEQRLRAELDEAFAESERRYQDLISGNAELGIPAEPDPGLVADVRERHDRFVREFRPTILEHADKAPSATGDGLLQGIAGDLVRETREANANAEKLVRQRIARFRNLQIAAAAVLAAVAAAAIAVLTMLVRRIGETANQLAAATAQIAAASKEQASASQQQASAVYETLTAADQVGHTSEQVASRAKSVAESARKSDEIGSHGRQAIDQALSTMGRAKEKSDSIAESILALAEQTQSVGEILSAIDEIAEQTHVLSLNAAIEAARAGEHGRGFSIVAAEVRGLAQQAKNSTVQVRRILGEVQRMANRAVLNTEEGTRSMGAAVQAANEAGGTIRTLVDAISEWSRTANQIAQGAGQQVTGLNQINQAIKSISDATNQNLTSTRQTEEAATHLGRMGTKLRDLVSGTT